MCGFATCAYNLWSSHCGYYVGLCEVYNIFLFKNGTGLFCSIWLWPLGSQSTLCVRFFLIKYYNNIILGRLILCLKLFWPVDSGLAFLLCPNLPSFLIFFLFTFNIFTPGYPSPFSIMNIMGSLVLLINKNKL